MKYLSLFFIALLITSCKGSAPHTDPTDSFKHVTVDTIIKQRKIAEQVMRTCPIKILKEYIKTVNTYQRGEYVLMKNVSDKPIDGVKIHIGLYDNFGGNLDKMDGIYQKIILPQKSGYELWEVENTLATKTKLEVFLVHFTDGTVWKSE